MLSIVQYLSLSDQYRADYERIIDTDCRVDARAYAAHVRRERDAEAFLRMSEADQHLLIRIVAQAPVNPQF